MKSFIALAFALAIAPLLECAQQTPDTQRLQAPLWLQTIALLVRT